ncbi:hypothetical protein G3580_09495 [Nitrogeniibacter mangrovi]|uniref:Phosphoglycerate mutase n=1 Tax=Nitrogeniibacter mangrovi TaxID=2016596 RepID=A0A6C1B388_9RHOO|nr:hypothetical protein [Nitrogeniibacter mangrovi]QID17853.1 hypothetical protein G3580_09495 [Nitrogeniibacter mangrovi]
MNLHLVIPGLLWPNEQARGFADTLRVPALTTLLGRAQCLRTDAATPEAMLRALFGVAADTEADAALRRLGEDDGLRVTDPMLCADPTHLHFARDHLLLADATDLDIRPEEADALVAGLNDTFADIGRFEAATPTRWYLYPCRDTEVRFAPLGDVTSRPVAFFMPEGPDATRWHRSANEIQVYLHNHPVNAAREARGLRPVNNVWFWGYGALPGLLTPPATRLLTRSPLGRGLARAAGCEAVEPERFDALGDADSALVELDTLLGPSRYLDVGRWQSALEQLEQDWFAPVLAQLRARRVRSLTLSIPDERGSRVLTLTPNRLLQFWRKVESLEAFTILQQL